MPSAATASIESAKGRHPPPRPRGPLTGCAGRAKISLQSRSGRDRGQRGAQRLTDREHEILALVAQGRSNRSIADRLELSTKTVEGAIGIILSKLGLEEDGRDNRRVLAYLDSGKVRA